VVPVPPSVWSPSGDGIILRTKGRIGLDEERVIQLLSRLESTVVRLLNDWGRYANGALGQHTRDIRELEERLNTVENNVSALERREAASGQRKA